MYTRELLLVAGILLVLVLGRREHLAFTETVKDIRNTVSEPERDRIFEMAPASLQQHAREAQAATGLPVDRTKVILAKIVGEFQTEVYVPATAPITEAAIDNYVAAKRQYYQATPQAAHSEFYLRAYSNGDAKRLLMTYFNLTRALLTADRLPTSSGATTSIPQVLEQMRDMLLEYKMSGDTRYKSAYDGLKTWMDRYVSELNLKLTQEADTVTSDVSSYQTANADLTKTQADFRTAVKEGPEVENAYLTIKRQMDQGGPAPDTSSATYVKGGIAIGLVVGAIVLSLA